MAMRTSKFSGMLMVGLLAGTGWAFVLVFGQTTSPKTPPSDISKSKDAKKAHTNYLYIDPASQLQKPTLSQPLDQVAISQRPVQGYQISIPPSDISYQDVGERMARYAIMMHAPRPMNAKMRAHTNYKVLVRRSDDPGIPVSSPDGELPGSILANYNLPVGGGNGVIVIVDAYDYPTAEADLRVFSAAFPTLSLPECTVASGCLRIVKMDSSIPPDTDPKVQDCGWSGEAAIDLQWAHAIAPKAKLILVEAKSSDRDDMFDAVRKAADLVLAEGGGQIVMSWSLEEFEGENSYDEVFRPGVLYFGASGDLGGAVTYPSSSPFVIAVGGTRILRGTDGGFVVEEGWNGSGGGTSRFELQPQFQVGVENIIDPKRSTPDLAATAAIDVNGAGSPVYAGTVCSGNSGWYRVGGTSLATPIVAAGTNVANRRRASVSEELGAVYGNRKNSGRIRDITVGTSGANLATPGYDKVTGVGVIRGVDFDGKP